MEEVTVTQNPPTDCRIGLHSEIDAKVEIDPLSYLNRDEFTSEKHKIEIRFVLFTLSQPHSPKFF